MSPHHDHEDPDAGPHRLRGRDPGGVGLLDGEVTDDERERLRRHLDQCPACLRHYGVEERIRS